MNDIDEPSTEDRIITEPRVDDPLAEVPEPEAPPSEQYIKEPLNPNTIDEPYYD